MFLSSRIPPSVIQARRRRVDLRAAISTDQHTAQARDAQSARHPSTWPGALLIVATLGVVWFLWSLHLDALGTEAVHPAPRLAGVRETPAVTKTSPPVVIPQPFAAQVEHARQTICLHNAVVASHAVHFRNTGRPLRAALKEMQSALDTVYAIEVMPPQDRAALLTTWTHIVRTVYAHPRGTFQPEAAMEVSFTGCMGGTTGHTARPQGVRGF